MQTCDLLVYDSRTVTCQSLPASVSAHEFKIVWTRYVFDFYIYNYAVLIALI